VSARAPWNHNLHYHPVLLAAVPQRCERALDVGCGEGVFARKLLPSVATVTAIDRDQDVIETARRLEAGSEIDYLVGDFMTFPLEPESFELVVCVAALHHMDEEAALRRMADLLRPGGTLAVLGLARSRYPRDLGRDLLATGANWIHRLARGYWESPAATVWPPPHTFLGVRAITERVLPGAHFRRYLLWRYSIVWGKPSA
jgi:SAM-dependent methyltransferase